MQQKRSDLWEQRKLSVKAKYLDVTLNFFTCKWKTVNENNWDMDAHWCPEIEWSCHGESGKWKFEKTVTLMGRWPKTNVYHIDQGIYRVDHLKRNCIGTI